MVPYVRDQGAIRGRTPSIGKPVVRRASAFRAAAEEVAGWQLRGACGNEDPELFFPVGDTPPAQRQAEDAKAVCRTCSVIDSCRAWVRANPSQTEHGVWAGMSEKDRESAKRREARERQNAAKAARSGGVS